MIAGKAHQCQKCGAAYTSAIWLRNHVNNKLCKSHKRTSSYRGKGRTRWGCQVPAPAVGDAPHGADGAAAPALQLPHSDVVNKDLQLLVSGRLTKILGRYSIVIRSSPQIFWLRVIGFVNRPQFLNFICIIHLYIIFVRIRQVQQRSACIDSDVIMLSSGAR